MTDVLGRNVGRVWLRRMMMKNLFNKKFLVFASLAVVAISFIAAKPNSGMEETSRTTAIDVNHVEQQRELPDGPKIVNSTGCLWDADDELVVTHAGKLKPGESHTITECLIEDWTDHRVAIVASVKSKPLPDLTISIRFVRRGEVLSTSELVSREKRFSELRICTKSHHYDRQDTTGEILGDGYGWPTDIEFTITNNSKRRVEVSLTGAIVGDSSAATTRWCR